MTLSGRDLDRFWSKVHVTDGCWEWRGCRTIDGYGRFHFGGKESTAHRVSFVVAHGEIPVGMLVCHHCDNPPCVNPAHLFAGTAKDNTDDMWRKGRAAGKRRPEALRRPRRKGPEIVLADPAEEAVFAQWKALAERVRTASKTMGASQHMRRLNDLARGQRGRSAPLGIMRVVEEMRDGGIPLEAVQDRLSGFVAMVVAEVYAE